MEALVLLVSFVLFFFEWYVIRKTNIKAIVPILATVLTGLPIGMAWGLHLVTYPVLAVLLAWTLCLIEDELMERFGRRGLSEEDRSRLEDL